MRFGFERDSVCVCANVVVTGEGEGAGAVEGSKCKN